MHTNPASQQVSQNTTASGPQTTEASSAFQSVTPPAVQLPKGGGAIRGMGEKFAANPVTGTGSMSVPIVTSPGRSGFGPQLSLSYDSGAGNGPFGFGWNLSLPAITRKTDKGLPRYFDNEESDVFILSGAEDLVPEFKKDAAGNWDLRNGKHVIHDEPRTVDGVTYQVRRYRPRIEGLFARIERWTNTGDATDVFWRSISKDNVTTWYGKTAESRIIDPADQTRIFSWLICQSYDDKGNAMVYEYQGEDSQHIFEDAEAKPVALVHEANRTDKADKLRSANRYLKRIKYGNRTPNRDGATWQATDPTQLAKDNWMFEVVFDYGERHYAEELPDADQRIFATALIDPPANSHWPARQDRFSSYRAGFEVRTYRLCHRVLMFHHFPAELETADYLVRATEFTYAESPIASFITSVTQAGFKRQDNGSYLKRSLPPLEFEYSEVPAPAELAQQPIVEVDADSLENLPIGLDGANYPWIDFDGEGISGILTEQAGAWFYKRNLSPINEKTDNGKTRLEAQFSSTELVAARPNLGLAGGAQFMDLAGDGQPDLVVLDGPMPGFYEHDDDEGWQSFRPFTSRLNRETRDPNLKFVDLNGDGHADVLITEDDAFVWHVSLAEEGFGPASRVAQALDEESGPRLVFADGTQSIYLADLSGDGLTDLARIRNGEVCYWPNLGYGRFGAKVTMDNAPWFDYSDPFSQQRIRLADIDGSGTTDIIYLGGQEVSLYFNQSGNSWSEAHPIPFPAIDNLAAVQAVDLLGNGTACLVWSSPLPGNGRRSMRYLDLMGGQKPHLLVKTVNNLGAETRVVYASSTNFYLRDKRDGKPWITRLPFPVHVVEKVTVKDTWRQTTFASTYSYHHGYFDGSEREFRGFGRVEQVDSESYGEFASGNSASPYIAVDKTLYQPPVKTVTWYHTGAAFDRERILSQFEHEYFPRWFEDMRPNELDVLGGFQENLLPEPDLATADLSAEEWREALRSCKGMMLRQEIYELDVNALEHGDHWPVNLFTTAYHNCHIRRLQPKALNPHAVFLVAESEAITYHYELDLTEATVRPDPRIAHTLNLQFGEYANVLQSVAVVYCRRGQFEDSTLPADALALIRGVQQEPHLAYTETRYTEDFGSKPAEKIEALDNYRLRVPCEVLTYELTGIGPEDADDLVTPDLRDNLYFTLAELRRFRLSLVHQTSGTSVPDIPYQQIPKGTTPEKRLVEHARMLFFKDDAAVLTDPRPLGELGRLGLPYETYKLALTEELLNVVFADANGNKLDKPVRGANTARQLLGDAGVSGYLSGADLVARFASVPAAELAGQYWIRSGSAGFAPDAAQHFYLPECYTDPFGNVTTLEYDSRDLFVASSMDALGNTTSVKQFDFRVLAPREMQDINDNLSEVFFDVLGLPTTMAVKGNGTEADNLTGFTDALANPALADLMAFFDAADLDEGQARAWLGNTTARHVYYFGETRNGDGSTTWGSHPACACAILREQHVNPPVPGDPSPLQTAFEYSDGLGSVVVKKVQAEPEAAGKPLRWVASGKTILNNKGKPVKQYEPYFSPPAVGHRFEEPREEGVTPVIYYDAAGRAVRTEMPDGSYSRVEFSPWHVRTFDQNDTVTETDNAWYESKTAATATAEEKRAAQLAAEHADTPSLTILDSLGREAISIAQSRIRDNAGGLKDVKYLTYTKFDAEGKPLWIRDGRGNLVMQYITPAKADNDASDAMPPEAVPCYDIAGNLLYQHSMDAGDRWMLMDAAGKPMFAWDSRGHTFRNDYDGLHRPVGSFVKGADPLDPNRVIQFEKVIYGDTPGNGLVDAKALNLRGKPYQHHDSAGIVTNMGHNPATGVNEAFDFKGNLLRSSRQLVSNYKETPDWSQNPTMEPEIFASSTRYDALNRPTALTTPDNSTLRPTYNETNLLNGVDVNLRGAAAEMPFVKNIDYNAKGQRLLIRYGNDVVTTHAYDDKTFRLIHLNTDRGVPFSADRPQGIQNLFYTYDPVGNITDIQDEAQHTIFFDNAVISPSNQYVYDALYRLIEAKGREHRGQVTDPQPEYNSSDFPRVNRPHPNQGDAMRAYTEIYDYDAVGNILRMIHQATNGNWTRRYDYEGSNNRLRNTSFPGDPADLSVRQPRYHYNTQGSMTRMPHLPQMDWDFKEQLQRVDMNGGGMAYYVYDATGQRVRKVTERQNGTRKEERIYLGGYEVHRKYDGAGNAVTMERETLHIMDDKQRIALVETRTQGNDQAPWQLIRYQFGNHLGSASLELDDRAQIISYEEYAPHGSTSYQAVRSQTETPKRYRYTGKERDEESGLYYHGARYYACWLGRWASSDPTGLVDGLNQFSYCHNNPIILKDPDGLSASPDRKEIGGPEFRQGQAFTGTETRAELDQIARDRGFRVEGNPYWEEGYGWRAELKPMGPSGSGGDTIASGQEGKLPGTSNPPPAEPSEIPTTIPVRSSTRVERHNGSAINEDGFWKSIGAGKAEPSFGKSLIPIIGSVQSANYHFDKGNWVRGTFWSAVAISDVFLVGSIAKGVGKIALKGGAALVTSEFVQGARLATTGNWRAFGETWRLLSGNARYGLRELIWNPKAYKTVGSQYWKGTANQLGMQLQHLWVMNSTRWVPQGLRNSGLNLLEIPRAFNQWMSNGISNQVFRLSVQTLMKADFLGSYSATQWMLDLHEKPVSTQEVTP